MKTIITSTIMKKAHLKVKIMKRDYPEINYRMQLGLEIKNLLAEEKKSYELNKMRVKIIRLVIENTMCQSSNEKMYGSDYETMQNVCYREMNIKRISYDKSYSPYELANLLIERNELQCRRYAL